MSVQVPPDLRPTNRDGFEIAIICALSIERDAVEASLDEEFEDSDFSYGKAPGDHNAYTAGRIGRHAIILAYMPGIGKVNSTAMAMGIRFSFPNIKIALIVGICGAAPISPEGKEVLLGDIVISQSVVQIDFGRQYNGRFVVKDDVENTLGRASPQIRAFLGKASGWRMKQRMIAKTKDYVSKMHHLDYDGFQDFRYPGVEKDQLYRPDYRHIHQYSSTTIRESGNCATCQKDEEPCLIANQSSCADLGCDSSQLVPRIRHRGQSTLAIHFGRISSGDSVIKSGRLRDEIAASHSITAFEMEAAGSWDYLPTVVIKSVCDYADCHKNKQWQGYAAITAAACTKAFLEEWRAEDSSRQAVSASEQWLFSRDVSESNLNRLHSQHLNQYPSDSTSLNSSWLEIDVKNVDNFSRSVPNLVDHSQIGILNSSNSSPAIEQKSKVIPMPTPYFDQITTLLANDNPHKKEAVLAIYWVLFALRPLHPAELYMAVLAGENNDLLQYHLSNLSGTGLTDEVVDRYITQISTGLICIETKPNLHVKFTSSSIREFFLDYKPPRAEDLKIAAIGHTTLRDCCLAYMEALLLHRLPSEREIRPLEREHLFLSYAPLHMFLHAENAAIQGTSQQSFLRQIQENRSLWSVTCQWLATSRPLSSYRTNSVQEVSLEHLLCNLALPNLTRAILDIEIVNSNRQIKRATKGRWMLATILRRMFDDKMNVPEQYTNPRETVQVLLDRAVDVQWPLQTGNRYVDRPMKAVINAAPTTPRDVKVSNEVIKCLLDAGVYVDEDDKSWLLERGFLE